MLHYVCVSSHHFIRHIGLSITVNFKKKALPLDLTLLNCKGSHFCDITDIK